MNEDDKFNFLEKVIESTQVMLDAAGQGCRPGTKDTPKRVAKAWWEMLQGYRQDPKSILGTTFESDNYDALVLVTNINFWSTCEHHLLPFQGTAHVAYLPGTIEGQEKSCRVVGLSKIPRLVHCYARRLQLQERLVASVAAELMEHETLNPRGVAVIGNAVHSCMACRGVKSQGSMTTSVMLGEFRTNAMLRQELLKLIEIERNR